MKLSERFDFLVVGLRKPHAKGLSLEAPPASHTGTRNVYIIEPIVSYLNPFAFSKSHAFLTGKVGFGTPN